MKILKRGVVVASLLATSLLASACSGGNSGSLNKEETAVVKVMYWDEQSFYQQYGNLFNAKFPNVEFQVVNQQSFYSDTENMDSEKAWEKFLQEEQPDVLMLSNDQYKKMAEKDVLMDLEPMMTEKDFKGEEINPSVIGFLKEQAGGKLYGLSPSFSSQALFYNADLFNKHGIEPPTNKMSWKEIIDLAKRFPDTGTKETREYGLSFDYQSSPYDFGMVIGFSEGLVLSDPEVTKILINTEGWKGAFQTAIDAMKTLAPMSENSMSGSYEDYLNQDSFLSGKAAMVVNSPYYVNKLRQAKKYTKDYKEFNWEIVTEPVDPNNRDYGSSFGSSEIFSIQANSPNAKVAWELVKYINSDEVAKFHSRTDRGNIMARTTYNKDKEGKNLEAFYALKPKANPLERFYAKIPGQFFQPLIELGEQEINLAAEGKKSLDEALQTLEMQLQQELVKERQKEEAEKAKKADGAKTSDGAAASSNATSGSVEVAQ